MNRDRRKNGRDMELTAGERQLIRQLRDVMGKMDGKPYQVSVVVVNGAWHIYEGVPRGKVKQELTE